MNKKALISLVSLLAMAGGYVLASAQVPPPPPGIGACGPSYLDASANILAGFGAPYNLFSAAKELLLGGTCSSNSLDLSVGTSNQSPATYVYNKGYIWRNNQWQQLTYTSNSPLLGNVWYKSSAQASVPLTPQELSKDIYVIAYTCSEVSPGQFKCGCRDTTCATNQWQLQKFSPGSGLPPGGGGGGGTTAVELKMDPDGPSGPMTPQTGTVLSKLVAPATLNLFYNPISMNAYIGDFSWNSGASSCKLDAYLPEPQNVRPPGTQDNPVLGSFGGSPGKALKSQTVFTYNDLPGTGSLKTPLPSYDSPYGGFEDSQEGGADLRMKMKFVMTCGDSSATIIAGADPSVELGGRLRSIGTNGLVLVNPNDIKGKPQIVLKAASSFDELFFSWGAGQNDGFSYGTMYDFSKTSGSWFCSTVGGATITGTFDWCKTKLLWHTINASSCNVTFDKLPQRPFNSGDVSAEQRASVRNGNHGIFTLFRIAGGHSRPVPSDYFASMATLTCKSGDGQTATATINLSK